ncbi:protein SWEETIE-like [Lotus japonicus]|uniref:protein SWEETIE-like n=1 Tax=Lotus japonicus TaxID=34305 RepID=UPI0025848C8D|nr:protein SWEETIE-like [Lotus japonicus]
MISGDQAVVRRMFSLISRPLNDFEDIYYPSFAEWVTSKIKIRLLAAHASLKCYIYASMRKHQDGVPDEYLALLPLFQKSSSILGKFWLHTLKDYSFMCLCLSPKRKWNMFLDGLQSPIVSSKLRPCLDESWPVILQALALDAVPVNSEGNDYPKALASNAEKHGVTSCQYSMVELKFEDFKFLWGFSLLGLFQSQHPILYRRIIQLDFANAKHGANSPSNEVKPSGVKLYEIVLPMFQFLSSERFFEAGLLTVDICRELLLILSYSTYMDNCWSSLAMSILSQVARNCPQEIFNCESFDLITLELCLHYLFKVFQSTDTINCEVNVMHLICSTTKAIINRIETKMHKHSKSVVLALVLIGYKCVRDASTEVYLSEAIEIVNCTSPLLKKIIDDEAGHGDSILPLREMFETCLSVVASLTKDCIEGFHLQEVKSFNKQKLIHTKLAFSLEQIISIAKLSLDSKYVECEASISIRALRCCLRCIQAVISYSNMQVQVIGLQFLKARIQRGVNTEDNSFFMFLVGELISDIFTLIHRMLKNTITRESVNIASECLSLMVLLQTLSKDNDCQRSFMNLLLEAIVMIFLSTGDGFSQDVSDLRNTAIKLVSRLAQIPSSANHFKDVLLSMPPLHRQQLQGVIRASVTQDKNPLELKVPVLDIKMPQSSGPNEEKRTVSAAPVMRTDENDKEEDEVSEDDWDAFQSFPVSKTEDGDESRTEHAAEGKDPSLVESSSDREGSIGSVEFQEFSVLKSLNREKELKVDEYLDDVKEKHDQTSPGSNETYDNEYQKMEEEFQSSEVATAIPGNELVSCDKNPEIEAEESIKDEHDNEDREMEEELQSSEVGTSIPGNEQVSCGQKPETKAEESIKDEHDNEDRVMEQELQSSEVGTSTPGNELVSCSQKPEIEAEESIKDEHDNGDQKMEEEWQNSEVATPIPGNEIVSSDQKPEIEAEESVNDEHDNEDQKMEEELQSSEVGSSIPGNELVSSDQKPEIEAEESANDEHDNKDQNMEEELQSSEVGSSIPGNELVSCDQKPEIEAEGSTKDDLVANYMPDQVVSDSLALQPGSCGSDNNEPSDRYDEDAKKESVDENKSHDRQQEMSESPVGSENNITKLEPSAEDRIE